MNTVERPPRGLSLLTDCCGVEHFLKTASGEDTAYKNHLWGEQFEKYRLGGRHCVQNCLWGEALENTASGAVTAYKTASGADTTYSVTNKTSGKKKTKMLREDDGEEG